MKHKPACALAIAFTILLLIVARSVAQPQVELEPRLGQAFVGVRQAEAAGATPVELSDLVALLNKALELEATLNAAPTEEQEKRAALRAQLDQLLTDLESRAGQLQVAASQRTQMNNVLAYVSGGIVAVLATVAYAYGVSFWRKYRIKRTFQMEISPK